MITIVAVVDAPAWMAQGVKEYLAMSVECFGDTRIISVTTDNTEPLPEQMTMRDGA